MINELRMFLGGKNVPDLNTKKEVFVSHSTKDTEEFGERFSKTLKSGDCIAMFGGMGMGKTAITRGIVKGLGCIDDVSSPTFAIVNVYRGEMPVYHFDMYRISSWDDLETTSYYDYLESHGITIIEWSENITKALPENCIRVTFSKNDENNCDERIITVER